MPKCGRCFGSGYESYVEDYREYNEVCYHCSGSGVIEDELYHQDRLFDVATIIAHYYEQECRKYRNTECEDPYYLIAAENGMTEYDYFRTRVFERQYDVFDRLIKLPLDMQNILIQWSQYDEKVY